MITENVIEKTTEQMLNESRVEIQKLHMMMQDQARDTSILFGMLEYFIQRCVESYDTDSIVNALDYMVHDTGLGWCEVAEAVDRMGVCDPTLCERDYIVTITVPVTISISVLAADAEDAELKARDLVDCNGLESYYMDYDLFYNADFETEVDG